MSVKAILFTVQHTGTRSALHSLRPGFDCVISYPQQETIGATCLQMHANRFDVDWLGSFPDAQIIVTVRDPLLSFISTAVRNDGNRDDQIENFEILFSVMKDRHCFQIACGSAAFDLQLAEIFKKLNLYDTPAPAQHIGAIPYYNALQTAYKMTDWDHIAVALDKEWEWCQKNKEQIKQFLSDGQQEIPPWLAD